MDGITISMLKIGYVIDHQNQPDQKYLSFCNSDSFVTTHFVTIICTNIFQYYSNGTLKTSYQISKFLCTQDICTETFYVNIPHHCNHNYISLRCFSGHAEWICLRSFYILSVSTLFWTTFYFSVFLTHILEKSMGGKGMTGKLLNTLVFMDIPLDNTLKTI